MFLIRCSLLSILSDHGAELPKSVTGSMDQVMILPGEMEGKASELELLINPPSPSTSGRFHPPSGHVHITLFKHASLSLLSMLVREITEALKPIESFLDIMVFLKIQTSHMFSAYIRYELKRLNAVSAVSLPTLGLALQGAWKVLLNVLDGRAKYKEVTAHGELSLQKLDVDKEFEVLVQCPKIGDRGRHGLLGIKCILKLVKYKSPIEKIREVCEQYHLQKCLKDENLKRLMSITKRVGTESMLEEMTPSEAKQMWDEVRETLCIEDEDKLTSALELFPEVADSVDFYHFLEEKQLTGKGDMAFHPQLQLVTAQLLHQEYDQKVLNHLFAAFNFILPFMNAEHDLQSLMTEIMSLDLKGGVIQLETVRKNLELIRLWFSRAEVSSLGCSS